MPKYVIQNQLARSGRPGYSGKPAPRVLTAEVDTWIAEVRALKIKIESIICLLSDDELLLYDQLPAGLIEYYRSERFKVEHVGARDCQLSCPLGGRSSEDLGGLPSAPEACARSLQRGHSSNWTGCLLHSEKTQRDGRRRSIGRGTQAGE